MNSFLCLIFLEKKCKIGYKSYDESCYKFVNAKKTFDDARKFCKKEGGDLMIINDQFKQGTNVKCTYGIYRPLVCIFALCVLTLWNIFFALFFALIFVLFFFCVIYMNSYLL